MIKRKILFYGYSRLIVLPKYWVEQNELKKGDSVIIKMCKDSKLIVEKK